MSYSRAVFILYYCLGNNNTDNIVIAVYKKENIWGEGYY